MKRNLLCALCTMAMAFTLMGCGDDPTLDDPKPKEYTADYKVYLINEGAWGKNDASIVGYDPQTNTCGYPTHYALGDVANSALVVDSMIYVTVTTSKTIVKTNGGIRHNVWETANTAYTPRYMAEKDGHLYVSCYGGIIQKLNARTLALEDELVLDGGANLEGVTIIGETLYVANSYSVDESYNYTYLDEILTVDLPTFKQGETLHSVINPNYLAVIGNDLYVLGFGDYEKTPYQLAKVNVKTGESTPIANASKMCVWNGKILYAYTETDWTTYVSTTTFGCYDPITGKTETNPLDLTGWEQLSGATIHSISANPYTNEVYVSISDYINTSDVYQFSAEGKPQQKFDSMGINANAFVFFK